MSVRSRKFFDLIQHHPSSLLNSARFRLPCPPYHNPDYWDRVYKDLDPDDVIEWGGFDLLNGMMQFRYEKVLRHRDGVDEQPEDGEDDGIHNGTFAECMNVSQFSTPEKAIQKFEEYQSSDNLTVNNESIALLGCGSSKFGEQLIRSAFVGPVLQIDISSKMIQLLTQRYQKYLSSESSSAKRMEFIVDDAKGLTALSPKTIGGGILDKGLIDVLHCSSGAISEDYDESIHNSRQEYEDSNPIRQIVDSAHRVLQPSRPFVFFSRTGPEYMLRRTFGTENWDEDVGKKWKDVEVIKLVDWDVLLYRFVKADDEIEAARNNPQILIKKNPKRRRR